MLADKGVHGVRHVGQVKAVVVERNDASWREARSRGVEVAAHILGRVMAIDHRETQRVGRDLDLC